jgi:hypothetical protein
VTIANSLFILEIHHKGQIKNLEQRFKERYGAEENWNYQVFEEFDKEKTHLKEKRAEDLSKKM